jgi:hypothetical protein
MKRIFLILILFSTVGCIQTARIESTSSITSLLNQDYKDKSYQNILIRVDVSDLESKTVLEDKIVNVLRSLQVPAVQSYTIFYPGTKISDDDYKQKIKFNSFDSVLEINFTSTYETSSYVEPAITTFGSFGRFGYSGTTYQTGGYYVSQQNFNIHSELFNTLDYGSVWMSDSHNHGCTDCSFETIMDSFADKLVSRLNADGIFGAFRNYPETEEEKSLDAISQQKINQLSHP